MWPETALDLLRLEFTGISTMKTPENALNSRISEVIESRSPAGQNDSVKGWHNLLKRLFTQLSPHLREGQLITFRDLNDRERAFFEEFHPQVKVPPGVGAIYLPPSVRFQMMYQRPEGEPQPLIEHSPENSPDKGIVLAARRTDFNVVVNALFAKPPFTPAIDVYSDGQLLAGYVYSTIDECIEDLTRVLEIHLRTQHDK